MIFQIGEIHCMPQTDISQMQFLERKMPQHIHISHESYPEISATSEAMAFSSGDSQIILGLSE